MTNEITNYIHMKYSIYLFISIFLLSCGSKEEKTKEEPKEESKTKEETSSDKNKLCFENNSQECEGSPGSFLQCTMTMTIVGDTVKANSFCKGCEGAGESFYEGIKHEDTLILNEIFTEADGNKILTETFWIMSGDQLNQLVTMKKNGKTILKEQATHTFLASYVKVKCE